MCWLKTLSIVLVLGCLATSQSPFEEGPFKTNYVYGCPDHEDIDTAGEENIVHDISVFSPDEPGNFPVIYFTAGFFGLIPPDAYSAVLTRVASHGYTVLSPHHLNITIDEVHGQWLNDVDAWCREYLVDRLIAEGFNENLTLDFDNQYLIGHSAGCHVLCEYLKSDCHAARGLVMLSPVDGVDPFGQVEDYCITVRQKINFEIPALIIAGGLDSIPASDSSLDPSCAPEELSNQRYFDAMPGTVWMVNATEFGHADMLDFVYWTLMHSVNFCSANEGGAIVLRDFRNFVAGEIVAFLKGINDGDCEMLEYLEDPDLLSIAVELTKDEVVSNEDLCGGGYCGWNEPSN